MLFRSKNGEWKRSKYNGVELSEKTVGIVGLGRIGVLVAQRLSAFGVKLIAYDPYVQPARAAQIGVRLVPLDELMRESDFITVHLPKTPETAGLIGAAVFMPGVGEAIDAAALTAEGTETAATLTEATEGASAAVNPASVGDASAAADANAATEGVATESEGAANESAGKFKPTGARSLADINQQGRVGALKNLVSGADDGATRAQALYNSRYAAGIGAMDMANDVIQTDNKDLGSDGSDDNDTGSQQQMQQMQQQMQQQQDTMRRQAQQAAASAAQANAFAANSAALRHGDYLNPFG